MAFFFVGMAFGNQVLDHRHHRADPFGRAGFMVRTHRAEGIHVVMIPRDRFIGDVTDRAIIAGGTGVDFVINVSEVPHVSHCICTINMAKKTVENIKHQNWPRVPEVGAVINGRAADIHAHVLRVDRFKDLFFAGLRVMEFDRGHTASHTGFSPAGLATY